MLPYKVTSVKEWLRIDIYSRIKKKREEAGLSKAELAARVGVTPPAISQYESGIRTPSHSIILKLSNALNVPPGYLTGTEEEYPFVGDNRLQAMIKNWPYLVEDKKAQIFNHFQAVVNSGVHMTIDQGEQFLKPTDYAKKLLVETGQNSLPIDVRQICMDLGIDIQDACDLNEYETLMIKMSRDREEASIFISNRFLYESRKRFSIAHALGHLNIPWHLRTVYQCRKVNYGSFLSEDVQEEEANSFAAELLMPEEHFRSNIPDLSDKEFHMFQMIDLAEQTYDVSLAALLHRFALLNGGVSVVTAENGVIKYDVSPSFPYTIAINGKLSTNSVAYKLYNGDNCENREEHPTRQASYAYGVVPVSAWIKDAGEDVWLYERTLFMKEFNRTITLLSILT